MRHIGSLIHVCALHRAAARGLLLPLPLLPAAAAAHPRELAKAMSSVPEEYRMTEAERFTFDLCAHTPQALRSTDSCSVARQVPPRLHVSICP